MKRTVCLLMIASLMIAGITLPARAGEGPPPPFPIQSQDSAKNPQAAAVEKEAPPGELILADVLILRPLGIVACGVGLVGSIITLPFAATSQSGDRVGKALIEKPFNYTFQRPVGEVDY